MGIQQQHLNVLAFPSPSLLSILKFTFHLISSDVQMVKPVKLGGWGGSGGLPHDIDGQSKRLVKIVIRSGDAINSLAFEYVDQDGKKKTAGPWGGSDGSSTTIEFRSDEYLTKVSGTTGTFDRIPVVRSLRFVTNKEEYGPFGQEEGTPFSIPVASGQVVSFYVRSSGYVDAIGLYVVPA
uniref:Jacalin-type lectin domain-containing protein n=1 Tax=Ananas comosus var. bracteatus TaxID=296719 RepID=A0A6V7NEK5_ANACO|nr:unnamed protein product [Ananas comosus var. bracteatus]